MSIAISRQEHSTDGRRVSAAYTQTYEIGGERTEDRRIALGGHGSVERRDQRASIPQPQCHVAQYSRPSAATTDAETRQA